MKPSLRQPPTRHAHLCASLEASCSAACHYLRLFLILSSYDPVCVEYPALHMVDFMFSVLRRAQGRWREAGESFILTDVMIFLLQGML